MTPTNPHEAPVLIVGGGFSGTLLAINLQRMGARVTLIERDANGVAHGLAFGTRRPEHLLNVRAANMSAFPDDRDHFLRWMRFDTADQANRFVPRLTYGQYLRELLHSAMAAGPDRITVVTGTAVAAETGAQGVRVTLNNGRTIAGRALVLAMGNFPPTPFAPFAGLRGSIYAADPWQPGLIASIGADEDLLLLGTGLTAIDVALSLEAAGWRGRITALSRRGLLPHAHAETGPQVQHVPCPQVRGSHLVAQVRRRAREIGWRAAVDELRPHTQNLWRRHDLAAQRRFLRHLRPWWDVHRHRLAPVVAGRIAALRAAERFTVAAGRVVAVDAAAEGARVWWRPRGEHSVQAMDVGRIINCTGPAADLAGVSDPLLRGLLTAGCIRPDAHRLGLDVDHLGRVRDAQGTARDNLFAVGPLTRGAAWEIIAVPDIRRQVWDLARYLTNSHWVAGEGL